MARRREIGVNNNNKKTGQKNWEVEEKGGRAKRENEWRGSIIFNRGKSLIG